MRFSLNKLYIKSRDFICSLFANKQVRSYSEQLEETPSYKTYEPVNLERKKVIMVRGQEFSLEFFEGIVPNFSLSSKPENYNYITPKSNGIVEQINNGNVRDERELVIGFDFGTSCVKIVIGDPVLNKAFAVPFGDYEDANKYLLPSRLYQHNASFSLVAGQKIYRDLKLELLANPDDIQSQLRVVAFLALVIRHARGWLYSAEKSTYATTNILWKLVLGLPSSHHLDGKLLEIYQRLASLAWFVAGSSEPDINESYLHKLVESDSKVSLPSINAEISVVPEISAQIYGYVSSSKFDPKIKNRFLMVDVGAGTVDSSLFEVQPGRGGKWDITFYTCNVEPNGVVNLHRHRINWWQKVIIQFKERFGLNPDTVFSRELFSDIQLGIPNNYKDYLSGVNVIFDQDKKDPDQHFFMMRYITQVRGKTLWRTWKNNFLTQEDLKGIPMFLCGGGSRIEFYRALESEIPKMTGCTWLSAIPRRLEVPENLIAPGLHKDDYDRMSVAYGLSFLEVRSVLQATAAPLIESDHSISWRDNYVDKDQC